MHSRLGTGRPSWSYDYVCIVYRTIQHQYRVTFKVEKSSLKQFTQYTSPCQTSIMTIDDVFCRYYVVQCARARTAVQCKT